MKRIVVILSAVTCLAILLIQAGSAQDSKLPSNFPIVPITVDFQVIPQFFRQPMQSSVKYSSIDALIKNDAANPWYEVILREKASNKQVYYTNSQKTVALLTGRGEEAYFSPIEFHSSLGADSHAVFTIRFQDSSQQAVQWDFIPGAVENNKVEPNG